MDPFAYASHPNSAHSSPRSREIEGEAASVAVPTAYDDLQPPPPVARVKLMCSYGGRIQPRSHDNQLTYVGGDTKILAVDRSISYFSIIAKLSAIVSSDDFILKYQLPGEDLDALISVTNDEDLEHMMIEYDRLHRTGSKPVARLRMFLFFATGKSSQYSESIVDPSPTVTPREAPDYLFGLEPASFPLVEAEVAEVKDQVAEKTASPAKLEVETVDTAPVESQVNVQETQKLPVGEKQQAQEQAQVSPNKGNGNDETLETLARVSPTEYFLTPVQEKAPTTAPPVYWQDHLGSVAPQPRFASFVPGDGNCYFIPANPGIFHANGVPGVGYFATMQRVVPSPAYDSTVELYSVAAPPVAKPGAYANDMRAQAVEVSRGCGALPAAGPYDNGAGYPAYDSAGRESGLLRGNRNGVHGLDS